jgi:hypothetical protein
VQRHHCHRDGNGQMGLAHTAGPTSSRCSVCSSNVVCRARPCSSCS